MIVNEILIILCVDYFYDYILRKYYEKKYARYKPSIFFMVRETGLEPVW